MMLDKIREIVRTGTAKEIEGVLVDKQTANLIIQLADISEDHKAKIEEFLNKSVTRTCKLVWSLDRE